MNNNIEATTEEARDDHRTDVVHQTIFSADRHFRELHPTHKAKAFRELGELAADRAKRIEEFNDNHGVPE